MRRLEAGEKGRRVRSDPSSAIAILLFFHVKRTTQGMMCDDEKHQELYDGFPWGNPAILKDLGGFVIYLHVFSG